MKALVITADHFEDSELSVPLSRLQQEGLEVVIASIRPGTIRGKHGYEAQAGLSLAQVNPDDYHILILPGGKAPALLRKESVALDIARSFFQRNKPVAAICHGPQILISAGLMKGRRATCYRSVAWEMREAGAIYEDREVVVDGNLITSRQPSICRPLRGRSSKCSICRRSPAQALDRASRRLSATSARRAGGVP